MTGGAQASWIAIGWPVTHSEGWWRDQRNDGTLYLVEWVPTSNLGQYAISMSCAIECYLRALFESVTDGYFKNASNWNRERIMTIFPEN